jgi:DNA-binding response OmpR family regulator
MAAGGARVLVADDDVSVRTLVELALRRQGHEVVLAGDADAAAAAADDLLRPATEAIVTFLEDFEDTDEGDDR